MNWLIRQFFFLIWILIFLVCATRSNKYYYLFVFQILNRQFSVIHLNPNYLISVFHMELFSILPKSLYISKRVPRRHCSSNSPPWCRTNKKINKKKRQQKIKPQKKSKASRIALLKRALSKLTILQLKSILPAALWLDFTHCRFRVATFREQQQQQLNSIHT